MLVARHVAWGSGASKAPSPKRRAGWARFLARGGSPWAPESRLGVAGVDGAPARGAAIRVRGPLTRWSVRTGEQPAVRSSNESRVPAAYQQIMDSGPINRPEHVRALKRANEVRRARALIKRRIASGDLSAAEVILSHRWELDSMRIAELLLSQRRWGQTRCEKFLERVTMPQNKSIGSLTERQRIAVAALLSTNARDGPPNRPRADLKSDADAAP
jgi:hypothetical protein